MPQSNEQSYTLLRYLSWVIIVIDCCENSTVKNKLLSSGFVCLFLCQTNQGPQHLSIQNRPVHCVRNELEICNTVKIFTQSKILLRAMFVFSF